MRNEKYKKKLLPLLLVISQSFLCGFRGRAEEMKNGKSILFMTFKTFHLFFISLIRKFSSFFQHWDVNMHVVIPKLNLMSIYSMDYRERDFNLFTLQGLFILQEFSFSKSNLISHKKGRKCCYYSKSLECRIT